VGIDTHRDEHVAVAVDGLGRRLGERRFAATAAGNAALVRWVGSFGGSPLAAVEGSGSYGKALTRALRAAQVPVLEVARADRQERRRVGKDDPTDAEQAARSALSGRAQAVAKDGEGPVEQLRMVRLCRRSAVKARTEAICQLKALLVTAPAELRDALAGHSTPQLLRAARAFRPGPAPTSTAAV
jgi:hypothetical protein